VEHYRRLWKPNEVGLSTKEATLFEQFVKALIIANTCNSSATMVLGSIRSKKIHLCRNIQNTRKNDVKIINYKGKKKQHNVNMMALCISTTYKDNYLPTSQMLSVNCYMERWLPSWLMIMSSSQMLSVSRYM
jgi:hypothetical protein